MKSETVFLTREQAVEAVCRDFRQYAPQLLLFCEVLRLVSGRETRFAARDPQKRRLDQCLRPPKDALAGGAGIAGASLRGAGAGPFRPPQSWRRSAPGFSKPGLFRQWHPIPARSGFASKPACTASPAVSADSAAAIWITVTRSAPPMSPAGSPWGAAIFFAGWGFTAAPTPSRPTGPGWTRPPANWRPVAPF